MLLIWGICISDGCSCGELRTGTACLEKEKNLEISENRWHLQAREFLKLDRIGMKNSKNYGIVLP